MNCYLLNLVVLSTFMFQSMAYTKEEIFRDSLWLPVKHLLPFRGPILKDVWFKDTSVESENPCDYGLTGWQPKECQQILEKDEQLCSQLFVYTLKHQELIWPPFKLSDISNSLVDQFTMGGLADTLLWYFQDTQQNGGEGYNWNSSYVEAYRSEPNTCGPYFGVNFPPRCDYLSSRHQNLIHGKRGVVIGSLNPWAEAMLLNAGAKHITTIEYMQIFTDHPKLSSLLPIEAAERYLTKDWKPVDFAFSYSSLEHDGLGRYGDPLNPFGDLESIARVRCLLKQGGIFFLGLPTSADAVAFNAHRLYGRYRTALVLLGWRLLDVVNENCSVEQESLMESACHTIFVLEKIIQ